MGQVFNLSHLSPLFPAEKPAPPGEGPPPKPDDKPATTPNDLDRLKQQMEEMQKKLDAIAAAKS